MHYFSNLFSLRTSSEKCPYPFIGSNRMYLVTQNISIHLTSSSLPLRHKNKSQRMGQIKAYPKMFLKETTEWSGLLI